MAYIGRDTDKISNVEVLDNITFDGSSSYTLQKSSVNFTPSSANTLLLSIDGIVQAGNFTVSGSTIDFGTAVAGTSTCNFVLHYGVGLITAPSDGTVTTAKLADSSVSLAKLTATGTKDATTFLRGDNTFAVVSSDFVKLASGSFSSNSLSFDGYFTSAYSHYKIILTDVIPSTNNPNISMRYRISDADVTTSDYQNVGQHGAIQIGVASSDGTSNQTNTDQFKLQQGYAVSNASNLCMNAELTIFNPLNTSLYKHYHYKSSCHYSSATGYWVTSTGGGYYDANTTALSGFTIFASSGNITSGNCYLYGVKA